MKAEQQLLKWGAVRSIMDKHKKAVFERINEDRKILSNKKKNTKLTYAKSSNTRQFYIYGYVEWRMTMEPNNRKNTITTGNHKYTRELKMQEYEENYNMPERSQNTNVNVCSFLKQKKRLRRGQL